MESGVNPTNPALVPWAVRKCENEVRCMNCMAWHE